MPPRPDNARKACDRSATTLAASSSDSAPATQAAAISPCEWPTTAVGRIPWDCHTRAKDTMIAHNAGWTTSTWSKVAASSSPRTTDNRSHSTNGESAAAHSAIAAANTGQDPNRSRPIPGHCEPWPGNTSTTPESGAPAATPRTTLAASRPSASARSPSTNSARFEPSTTARCSRAARVVANDHPASTTEISGDERTNSAKRSAWARNAPSDRPDSTHGTGGQVDSSGSSTVAGSVMSTARLASVSSAGACSMITWALVPEIPNADTPARRGRSASCQG